MTSAPTLSEPDQITLNFQQSIPFALVTASPNLAAFHLARLRPLKHPHLQSSTLLRDSPFCLKCGTLYTHSNSEIRVIRTTRGRRDKGKRKATIPSPAGDNSDSDQRVHARVLRHRCGVCWSTRDTPIAKTSREHVAAVPTRLNSPKVSTEVQAHPLPGKNPGPSMGGNANLTEPILPTSKAQPTPHDSSTSSPKPPPTGRSKSRPKNKSLLEAMLARNRKAEAARSTTVNKTPNLAAFLDGL